MSEEKNIEEINDNSIEKPKRKMSDKQKEALARGRQKAHEKLREAKKLQKEKDIKFKETQAEPILNVKSEEEEIEYVYKKKEKKEKPKPKPKKKVIVVEESSSSESESEEEQIEYVRKKKSSKKPQAPPPPPVETIQKPQKKIIFY